MFCAPVPAGEEGERYWRKKPVVIEAVRLPLAGEDVPYRTTLWLMENLPEGWSGTRDEGIDIPTLEGLMHANPGDWIIKGVKGEFYPCKPDIFAATYEPAASSPAPEIAPLIGAETLTERDRRTIAAIDAELIARAQQGEEHPMRRAACWAMHHAFVDGGLTTPSGLCGLVLLTGQCGQPAGAYIHQPCRDTATVPAGDEGTLARLMALPSFGELEHSLRLTADKRYVQEWEVTFYFGEDDDATYKGVTWQEAVRKAADALLSPSAHTETPAWCNRCGHEHVGGRGTACLVINCNCAAPILW
jgi:hypothetical protein